LSGHANALEYAISDLLLYSPLKIKIFSMDMRLSNKKLSSYGTVSASYLDVWTPTVGHDPFSQFTLMKSLFSQGLLDVDGNLKRILCLSVDEYMSELQDNYLDKALQNNV
jgi:hypothetical protein